MKLSWIAALNIALLLPLMGAEPALGDNLLQNADFTQWAAKEGKERPARWLFYSPKKEAEQAIETKRVEVDGQPGLLVKSPYGRTAILTNCNLPEPGKYRLEATVQPEKEMKTLSFVRSRLYLQ